MARSCVTTAALDSTASKCRAVMLLTLISAALLSGCDNGDSNDTKTSEPPQPLPSGFVDAQGTQWSCEQPQGVPIEDSNLTGTIRFPNGTPISRSDIVHITLLQSTSSAVVTEVSIQCINNIVNYSFGFEHPYHSEEINPDHQYLLAVHFFRKQESGEYQLTMQPDGFTEVINQGTISGITVLMESLSKSQ